MAKRKSFTALKQSAMNAVRRKDQMILPRRSKIPPIPNPPVVVATGGVVTDVTIPRTA